MNTPLRRVGLAMLAMIVLLLANATYIQIVKADDYNSDARNQRVLYEEYSAQRGQIVTDDGNRVIAGVQPTNDRLRYLRTYEHGPLYAPVTGYYSVRYGATGLEHYLDDILNGSDDRLFVRRLSDLITGRDPRGGNVQVTIDPQAQRAAYEAMTEQGFTGAVVALEPDTGKILTMVSTPSYDPSGLAAHDPDVQERTYNKYRDENNPKKPMLNRTISENYQPGSTFKLVVAAAALEDGMASDSEVTTSAGIDVITGETGCDPAASTCLANYSRSTCGTGTMESALQYSCNTAFAQLAARLGEDKLREQAARFGIGGSDLEIPMPVAPSCLGPREDCLNVVDEPALYHTGIGQRDVRLTPLQNAMVAASIANDGVVMRPQLVESILAPDLDEISSFSSDELSEAMSSDTAATLRDMMVLSEQYTCGCTNDIASKTGTAETGINPKEAPPYAWYVAFAPVDDPKVAVAVVVESEDVAATGGSVAADIGRSTMNAALGRR